MTLIGELYYFIYVINFATLLGSIFTFVVFSRKVFEKSSIQIYCQSLAIFDLFVLVPLLVGFIGAVQNVSITTVDDFWCKFVNFVTVGLSPIPGWILVVFSLDQLVIVSMTRRFPLFKKKWFQCSLIAGIFVFHCGLYSSTFVLIGRLKIAVNGGYDISCDTMSLVIPIIYLIESSLIPFIIIVIITILIVRILVKSRRRVSITVSLPAGNRSASLKTRELKFAFNSVVLNFFFIALTSPQIFHYIFPEEDYALNDLVTTICFVFFYLNFALHFWVHFVVNSVFRTEVLIILRIRKDLDRRRSIITNKNLLEIVQNI